MPALADSIKQNLGNITPIYPGDIAKIKHKAERPLFMLSALVTIVLVIVAFTSDIGDPLARYLFDDEGSEPSTLLEWVLVIPFIVVFFLYYTHAQTMAYAIRVSEKSFPEIYYKSVEFAKKLGMPSVPAVYIEQQNGVINAFAATVLGKRYVMLNAEIVDVAYMEHKDFDTVFFVLAHEFGHLYFRHGEFPRLLWTFIGNLIPGFGGLHMRAKEYSCDRVAQLLLERDCVREAMILSAGRHLYKYVDAEDYLAATKKEGGIFLWAVNLLASHPITPKRVAALADPQKKSGALL